MEKDMVRSTASSNILDNPLGFLTSRMVIGAVADQLGCDVESVFEMISEEVDSQLLKIVQNAAKRSIHSRTGLNLKHFNIPDSVSSERYKRNIYCTIQLRHILWTIGSARGSQLGYIIHRPVPSVPNLNKFIRIQDVAQNNGGNKSSSSSSSSSFSLGPTRGKSEASIYFLKEPDVSIPDLLNASGNLSSSNGNYATSSNKTQVTSIKIPNKVPVSPGFRIHWLVIQGTQPLIPENPTPKEIESMMKNDFTLKREREDQHGLGINSNNNSRSETIQSRILKCGPPLSKEHQIYFEKVTSVIESGKLSMKSEGNTDSENQNPVLNAVLLSLSNDSGIDGVIPHLVSFLSAKVKSSLRSLGDLFTCMQACKALISNKNIKIDLYLHELIPVVLTCLVGKRLCESAEEDHWSLREYVGGVIHEICRIHGGSYPNLQSRILETLHEALLDKTKPITTYYGAVVGIANLGPFAVEKLLLPLVPTFISRLENVPKATPKFLEAQHLINALQRAVGEYFSFKISQKMKSNQSGEMVSAVDLETIAMELGEPLAPFVSLLSWKSPSDFSDLSL